MTITRSYVMSMSAAEFKRLVRRAVREPGGIQTCRWLQDCRQGPRTGRREGFYRSAIAASLAIAGRARRDGAKHREVIRARIDHARRARRALQA